MSDEQPPPAQPTEPTEPTEPIVPPEAAESAESAEPGEQPARSHRARTVALAAVVVLLLVVGAVAWAVVAKLSGGGPQPETALPSDTLALASLDLDPSASQKIDALRTLRKFPDLRHQIGLSSTDEVRKYIYQQIIDQTSCHLDYASSVEPWLGSRVALAAVPLRGRIAPAVVVQVSDPAKARSAMATIQHCAGSGFGWSVGSHYLVVSRSTADARSIAAAAGRHSLADDATYEHWRSEVGRGELNFYVAPGAPRRAIGELLGSDEGAAAGSPLPGALGSEQNQLKKQLAHFGGAAGALRFDGSGGVELDAVADSGATSTERLGEQPVGPDVTRLPSDTAAVLGLGIPRAFVRIYLDQITSALGDTAGDPARAFKMATGLSLPGDVQTLLGRGLTLSVGATPPADVAKVASPSDVPLALAVRGDTAKIDHLLGTLQQHARFSLSQQGIAERINGDHLVLSTQQGYAAEVAHGGSLGTNGTFTAVVPEASRSVGILYAALSDAWRRSLVAAAASTDGAQDAARLDGDLKPLDAFGLSTWGEGSVLHVLVRLTTH